MLTKIRVFSPCSNDDEGTPVHSSEAEYTPVSTLSLRELRVQLLQRAAATATRARQCRAKGELRAAAVLEARAAKLSEIAKSVNVT
ncbi:MAG: hypothetical protein ACR2HR_17540 [Euzebya sp.]